mgnify:CR=1 FL=1
MIPNGIDLAYFSAAGGGAGARMAHGIPADAPVALVLGRLEPWKGQRVFIEAVPGMLARCPEAWFLVVGGEAVNKPGYRATLEARCAALKVGERVVFVDAVEDARDYLAAADVLVAPSVSPEPFGRTLAEAMAAGVAVVATRAGGPLDIVVEGETGLLAVPGDAASLAEAVGGLLSNRERASAMGAAGAARARERYGIDRLVREMVEVFEDLAH